MSVNYTLQPNRIIEVANFGKFYVLGFPEFAVCELPNADAKLNGWIIVQDADENNQNCVYKLNEHNQPVAKLLIKDLEMAKEIAFAANRIRV